MRVDELNLSAQLQAKLADAGLNRVADILAAGAAGLEAIDGIGPKTAADVLAAAQAAHAAHGQNGQTAPQPPGAEVVNHATLTLAQPTTPTQEQSAPPESDPTEIITIRNVSAEMILVGERYLLPTQTRTVQRRLIRHIPADKLLEV